jgi:hypothetical protein
MRASNEPRLPVDRRSAKSSLPTKSSNWGSPAPGGASFGSICAVIKFWSLSFPNPLLEETIAFAPSHHSAIARLFPLAGMSHDDATNQIQLPPIIKYRLTLRMRADYADGFPLQGSENRLQKRAMSFSSCPKFCGTVSHPSDSCGPTRIESIRQNRRVAWLPMNRPPSSHPSPPVGEKVPGGRMRGISYGSWPQLTSYVLIGEVFAPPRTARFWTAATKSAQPPLWI